MAVLSGIDSMLKLLVERFLTFGYIERVGLGVESLDELLPLQNVSICHRNLAKGRPHGNDGSPS